MRPYRARCTSPMSNMSDTRSSSETGSLPNHCS